MFSLARQMKYSSLICVVLFVAYSSQQLSADDRLKELMRTPGYIEIKLQEAHVPDLDPLPGQKESDVIARVYQVITPNIAPAELAKQNYTGQKKDLICETQTIHDDNTPKFDKKCITLKQVPGDAVIRIELVDSDKPAPEPDWIGAAMIRVADLIINRKLDSSESFPIDGLDYPKYYLKAKIDIKRND